MVVVFGRAELMKTYYRELPLEMVQKMSEIVNAPGNLKIVPQWLYDRVSI